MKAIRFLLVATAVAMMQDSARAQSFANLNFEAAQLPILQPARVHSPPPQVLYRDGMPIWGQSL